MTNDFNPALHPTASNGRFVTRSAKPAGFALRPPTVGEDEAPALVHPSGCGICGQERGSHGMTSRGGQGLHGYQDPTQAQRKERVTASVELQRSQREARSK